MRKILAFTAIRSEYDLMSRVYQCLQCDPQVDLRLLVSGAHLSPAHGYTVADIRKDGIPILAEIETDKATIEPTMAQLVSMSPKALSMFQRAST